MADTLHIPVRLAEAILLTNTEISFSEIRSLPMVTDDEQVRFIAESLAQRFEVSWSERQLGSHSTNWEETIKLTGLSQHSSHTLKNK